MKTIPLNEGLQTTVDDQDFDSFKGHRWFATKHKGKRYAARTVWSNNKGTRLYLHRIIAGAEKGKVVDHIDGDSLNNSRSNLRICRQTDNARNRVGGNSKSGLKGVWKGDPRCSKPWVASITVNRKKLFLGYFTTKEQAAEAYDSAAINHFGTFSKTNASMGLISCHPEKL